MVSLEKIKRTLTRFFPCPAKLSLQQRLAQQNISSRGVESRTPTNQTAKGNVSKEGQIKTYTNLNLEARQCIFRAPRSLSLKVESNSCSRPFSLSNQRQQISHSPTSEPKVSVSGWEGKSGFSHLATLAKFTNCYLELLRKLEVRL